MRTYSIIANLSDSEVTLCIDPKKVNAEETLEFTNLAAKEGFSFSLERENGTYFSPDPDFEGDQVALSKPLQKALANAGWQMVFED
jgi:hypothetical protein